MNESAGFGASQYCRPMPLTCTPSPSLANESCRDQTVRLGVHNLGTGTDQPASLNQGVIPVRV
jgi:hypothetical protein